MTSTLTEEDLAALKAQRCPEFTVTLTPSARALGRVASSDNPTKSIEIGRMKLYIAGLMTLCEPSAGIAMEERERCMSRAIDHLEDALLLIEKALKVR